MKGYCYTVAMSTSGSPHPAIHSTSTGRARQKQRTQRLLLDTARKLLALAASDPARPAACAYGGTLGVPAVLPRRLFHDLLALRGDHGAKPILLREKAAALPFPEGKTDLDTPEELERFRR